MTPAQLRDVAAQIMKHKSTVEAEGVVPQWLHDQLRAHAAKIEECERLRGLLSALFALVNGDIDRLLRSVNQQKFAHRPGRTLKKTLLRVHKDVEGFRAAV